MCARIRRIMSGFLDGAEITLSCPACGHEFHETLGRLQGNPNVICPGCGGMIDIKIEGREALDRANEALADFQKAIDGLD
jgi:rRNA maturation endonuclease Nob1